MLERLQLPTPMWLVHYQMSGGNRRTIPAAAAVAGVIALGIYVYRRAESNVPIAEVCAGGMTTLIVIQCCVLLLGGCNAVHRALLRDYETRMIESHRLTPMSNVGVVLGYVLGPPIQLLVISATIVFCGLALCVVGDINPGPWLVGNLLALFAAIPLWTLVVATGMRLGKPVSPLPFLLAAGGLSVPLFLLPGVALMLGMYSTAMAVAVGSGNAKPDATAVAVFAMTHGVLACYWIVIAATKYRRPELPALNGWRGLVLIVLWSLASVGGVVAYQTVLKQNLRSLYTNDVLTLQWVATFSMILPVVAAACAATAEYTLMTRRGRQPRGRTDRFPDLLGAAIFAAAPIAIAWVLASPFLSSALGETLDINATLQFTEGVNPKTSWLVTAAATFCAAYMARAVFLLCQCRPLAKPHRAGIRTIAYVSALWIFPPVIDMIRVAASSHADYLGVLSGSSPFGLIFLTWTYPAIPVWSGLAILAALVAILTIAASRVR